MVSESVDKEMPERGTPCFRQVKMEELGVSHQQAIPIWLVSTRSCALSGPPPQSSVAGIAARTLSFGARVVLVPGNVGLRLLVDLTVLRKVTISPFQWQMPVGNRGVR